MCAGAMGNQALCLCAVALLALQQLGAALGYALVYANRVNACFVRRDVLAQRGARFAHVDEAPQPPPASSTPSASTPAPSGRRV